MRPVLVVEDSEDDWLLLKAAFHRNGRGAELVRVTEARKALEYLELKSAQANLPALILCDAKLPELSGLDFLKMVREHTHFKDIPFLLLTSSGDPRDVDNARRYRATGYVVKPSTFDDLLKVCAVIRGFLANGEKELPSSLIGAIANNGGSSCSSRL
jgi:CheY-like chemotaxis protein